MPALGGHAGGGEPGGAGADHRDALLRARLAVAQLGLEGRPRVDQAGGAAVGEGMIEAGLVAGDAGVDLLGPAGTGLGHELRVGQQRPGHRYQVGLAGGEQGFGDLRGVDPVAGDHRHLQFVAQPCADLGEGRARHRGDDGRHARLVPADTGVEQGDAGFLQGQGDAPYFVPGIAALDQVEQRQAIAEDEAFADDPPDAADDLQRQAHAVFQRAAPLVVAAVGARAEELVEQVAFAAHHFHAVVGGGLGQPRATDEGADGLADATLGEFARGEPTDRRLQRRGGHRHRVVAIAPGVEDLQQDLAALGMHRLGQATMGGHLQGAGEAAAEGQQPTFAAGREAAGDDQPGAAPGALAVVGSELAEVPQTILQPGVHRTHHHAVAQTGEAQVQRGQQVRIGSGGERRVGVAHGAGPVARDASP